MIEGICGNLWIDVVKYGDEEYHAYLSVEINEGDVVQLKLSRKEYVELIYEVYKKAILLGIDEQDILDHEDP